MFLDVPADRYFCLSPEAERAVARLWRDRTIEAADRRAIVRLANAGLLVECEAACAVAPCPVPSRATQSLVGIGPSVGAAEIGTALLLLARVRIELRVAGLARTLGRVERRKGRPFASADARSIARAAAAFEACNSLVSAHDRCLPRSLAIAHRLIGIGAQPEIVLAVTLGPFKAHAWVQCGDTLINERIEVAHRFTPILVL